MARCAVPGRVQRAERIVRAFGIETDWFRRLTLRSTTGFSQREKHHLRRAGPYQPMVDRKAV